MTRQDSRIRHGLQGRHRWRVQESMPLRRGLHAIPWSGSLPHGVSCPQVSLCGVLFLGDINVLQTDGLLIISMAGRMGPNAVVLVLRLFVPE